MDLQVSQYVVSDESSSLIRHRSYSRFVCFLCWFIERLGNRRADHEFRRTVEAKGEGLDPVNMFEPPVIYYRPFKDGTYIVLFRCYIFLYPCIHGLLEYSHLNNSCPTTLWVTVTHYVPFVPFCNLKEKIDKNTVTAVFSWSSWMTSCLEKSCSFVLLCVSSADFINLYVCFFPFWFWGWGEGLGCIKFTLNIWLSSEEERICHSFFFWDMYFRNI